METRQFSTMKMDVTYRPATSTTPFWAALVTQIHKSVIRIRSMIFKQGLILSYESITDVSISGELDRNTMMRLNRIAFNEVA